MILLDLHYYPIYIAKTEKLFFKIQQINEKKGNPKANS